MILTRRRTGLYLPNPPAIAGGATIFSDGFESGSYSAWTGTTVSGAGSSLAVNGASKKTGNDGSQSVGSNAGNSSDAAYCFEAFSWPASTKVYCETWWQCPTFTTGGFNTATSKALLQLYDNGDSFERLCAIVLAGSPAYQMSYLSKNNTDTLITGTFTPSVGTWYRIKMLLDKSGTNPVLTWWTSTDGVTFTQRGTATDSTSGASGIGQAMSAPQIRAGIVHVNQFEPLNYTYYHDDVLVADSDPDVAAAQIPYQPNYWRAPFLAT